MEVKSYNVCQGKKSVIFVTDQGILQIYGIAENIMRCVYTKKEEVLEVSPVDIQVQDGVELHLKEDEKLYKVSSGSLGLEIEKETGMFTWKKEISQEILVKENEKELWEIPLLAYSTGKEKAVVKQVLTVDGERNYIENLQTTVDHMAYSGRLHFQFREDECIHGLGQGDEGIYNYRGNVQYLYQHNLRIPIPFFISNKQYAVLTDCGGLMTYNDDKRGSYLYLDAVEQMDYYMIMGESVDKLIAGYRKLTGKAAMLPKWAYGYIQSKEAYHNQEELISVASEYRKRNVGLDCVVQDWNTWEENCWGNKIVDKKRYPDLKKMNQIIHDLNVHTMISVWPNMHEGTANNEEMKEHGFLLENRSTYNAFKEEARQLYWKQAERELFSSGFDAWWCDSTEPFSGPDWNGAHLREPWERFRIVGEEHKKFLRADRANLYGMAHAKGIYENQRKAAPQKRVLNLTRAGYAGSQRYGTMLWSGDTCATWKNFRKQITEGLNMCISGMPYWTLDIGAFFTVHKKWENRGCGSHKNPDMKWFWKGDYEDGVADMGYRELYVRWFQYGAFLPMFRSHGTDTPREIWNFGEPGSMFYDALVNTIRFRYRLFPYIYSMVGKVYLEDSTIMRSLLFDFPEDSIAAKMDNEFMFGDSMLICPITKPMYYDRESKEIDVEKQWNCYLPAGEQWIDLRTYETWNGGQWITVPVTIDHIPVFIKMGSIIPMEQELHYAGEEVSSPMELHIYPGKDSRFLLYEDEGDGYGYEEGIFNRIPIEWNEAEGKVSIGSAKYDFPQSIMHRKLKLCCKGKEVVVDYCGQEMDVFI